MMNNLKITLKNIKIHYKLLWIWAHQDMIMEIILMHNLVIQSNGMKNG